MAAKKRGTASRVTVNTGTVASGDSTDSLETLTVVSLDSDPAVADDNESADAESAEAVAIRQDLPVWPKVQRMTDAELEGEIRGWSIPRLPDNHGLSRSQLEQFLMALNRQASIDATQLPSWDAFADSED